MFEEVDATFYRNEAASLLLWNESSGNFQASKDLLRQLALQKDNLAIKTGLQEENLPALMQQVGKARQHALEVDRQAQQLER